MIRTNSMDCLSQQSDIFYVERSSEQRSPARNITPLVLNSTELSGTHQSEVITNSPVASPEPQIVTIESDSNEPTVPYKYGLQQPITPSSLNDLNCAPNSFNVLNTMAVIHPNEEYCPQSLEPSNLSPFFMRSMYVSTIEGWETPHATRTDATFYSEEEPRRVYWDISSSDTFD